MSRPKYKLVAVYILFGYAYKHLPLSYVIRRDLVKVRACEVRRIGRCSVINCILLSAFVGGCIDCKNMHGMNNIIF